MAGVKLGDVAPDISLALDEGTIFSLKEHIGHPVVLYFYPEDDTGGCKTENQEFSQLKADFERLAACVVGISPDSIQSHLKFRKKYGLQIPLASDPERIAIEAFGVWQLKKLYGREFMGVVRTSFIIDGEGRVAGIMRATRIGGHAQKMLEALERHPTAAR